MATGSPNESRVLRMGIIGCGTKTQTIYFPALAALDSKFSITCLSDKSHQALAYCQKLVGSPATTTSSRLLCRSPDVDAVFVFSEKVLHTKYTLLALTHDKHVYVHGPLAYNSRDINLVKEAEEKSRGRVMLAQSERWSEAFVEVIEQITSETYITYVRVREINTKGPDFSALPGNFPPTFDDYGPDHDNTLLSVVTDTVSQGVREDCKLPVTNEPFQKWAWMITFASELLSSMREVLGLPTQVLAATFRVAPVILLFKYPDFYLSFETGLDLLRRKKAHIEVYGLEKTVDLKFGDVVGSRRSITLNIRKGTRTGSEDSVIHKTYQRSDITQLEQFYDMVVNGSVIPNGVTDAQENLKLSQMIMEAGGFNETYVNHSAQGNAAGD